MKKSDVVIIGGGPAGRSVVHMLHSVRSGLSVTLLKDEVTNVNRCAVPYGVSDKLPIEKFQISNKLVTDFGAELIVDTVDKIDTAGHMVHTARGETIGYRYLILATGSRPLKPPIPGIDAPYVTPVRSLEDLALLREFVATYEKAVIVGGGYIGIEVAVALRSLGLEVTVVEMMPHVLVASLEPEFVSTVEKVLTERGIKLLNEHKVTEFVSRDKHLSVKLEAGDSLEVDFAVLAVGVVPNIELAAHAGIKTSPLGIVTDEHMRTSAPDVFAVGDCAEKKSFISGRTTPGEYGTNAVFMSKVAALNILGRESVFPGVINASVTTAFDLSMGSAGLRESAARKAGFDVVTGSSEVSDKYPMMQNVSPIRTKLVFDRRSHKLLGGGVLRKDHGVAPNIDFLSLAIQMGATLEDLIVYQYATHPELAAKPSDNSFVMAARDALNRLKSTGDPKAGVRV